MMKKIAEGYNSHIVNMVGCVTLQEPLCLITEFVPYGDLLSYLKYQRKKVGIESVYYSALGMLNFSWTGKFPTAHDELWLH